MQNLVTKHFALNLRILRGYGLYPPKQHKTAYQVYSYILYAIFTVPPPILTALYLLLGENVDLAVVAQNAFAVGETGCFVYKLLQFIRNADKIRKCIYMLESPIFLTYTEKQQEFIDECINVCNRNSKFFFYFCILTAASWAVVPLFGNEYRLPLDIWLPYDVTSGGILYVVSYVVLVLEVSYDSTANGVIDPLIGGLAYYATAQIKILKNNLENLNENVQKTSNLEKENAEEKEVKRKIIHNKIKFCVEHHKAIVDYVKTYEQTFGPMVFVQFSASVVVICISCLQLSMVDPFTPTFFSMVIFINAVLLEIFFYCYYGTILFEESDTITNAAYASEWYDLDITAKKALMILMERFKRPMIVTSGKILDLSLNTFTTILRRSYSLLAVLKNYS